MSFETLSALEARIVAVLVEKQATVPDTYPLSLNSLVAGCNQKTARDPVMAVADSDVLSSIDELKRRSLVIEVSGSRVVRYEHNLGRVLGEPSQSVALLSTLMLRGPQTAAELRAHSERLHRFADVSSVEGFLEELAGRSPPKAVKLARQAGSREARWAHLLCGEPALGSQAFAPSGLALEGDAPADVYEELRRLRLDQQSLRDEVEQLRATVERLVADLGA